MEKCQVLVQKSNQPGAHVAEAWTCLRKKTAVESPPDLDPLSIIILEDAEGQLYALDRGATRLSLHLNDLCTDYPDSLLLAPIPTKASSECTQLFVRWMEMNKGRFSKKFLDTHEFDLCPASVDPDHDEWMSEYFTENSILYDECLQLADTMLCPIFGDVLLELEIARYLRLFSPERHRQFLEKTDQQLPKHVLRDVPGIGALLDDMLRGTADEGNAGPEASVSGPS